MIKFLNSCNCLKKVSFAALWVGLGFYTALFVLPQECLNNLRSVTPPHSAGQIPAQKPVEKKVYFENKTAFLDRNLTGFRQGKVPYIDPAVYIPGKISE